MKFLVLLASIAAVYFILSREAPLAPVKDAVTQRELGPLTTGDRNVSVARNALKRPLDRTHEVLSKARTRNAAGEF